MEFLSCISKSYSTVTKCTTGGEYDFPITTCCTVYSTDLTGSFSLKVVYKNSIDLHSLLDRSIHYYYSCVTLWIPSCLIDLPCKFPTVACVPWKIWFRGIVEELGRKECLGGVGGWWIPYSLVCTARGSRKLGSAIMTFAHSLGVLFLWVGSLLFYYYFIMIQPCCFVRTWKGPIIRYFRNTKIVTNFFAQFHVSVYGPKTT